MFTLTFWKDATERALKTAAQFLLVFLIGDSVNAFALDWMTIAGTVLAGALASYCTSMLSYHVGSTGTASMTKAVEPSNPADAPDEPEEPEELDSGRHEFPVPPSDPTL